MLNKFDFETDDEHKKAESEQLKEKYRMTFLVDEIGIEVLGDILKRLKFGCFLNEALGDIALNNAAIEILGMLKIIEPGNERNFIMSLANVTPKKEGYYETIFNLHVSFYHGDF
jgi:hypothetical protein